jgi:hypothetical protein
MPTNEAPQACGCNEQVPSAPQPIWTQQATRRNISWQAVIERSAPLTTYRRTLRRPSAFVRRATAGADSCARETGVHAVIVAKNAKLAGKEQESLFAYNDTCLGSQYPAPGSNRRPGSITPESPVAAASEPFRSSPQKRVANSKKRVTSLMARIPTECGGPRRISGSSPAFWYTALLGTGVPTACPKLKEFGPALHGDWTPALVGC